MKLAIALVKITFVGLLMLAMYGIYTQYLVYTNERYIETQILAQIEEASQVNAMLLHELEHMLSYEYVEASARDLGLVRELETLIIRTN